MSTSTVKLCFFGYYKLCHHPPPSPTPTTTHHHPKYTHHHSSHPKMTHDHLPLPKVNPPPPTTTQNKCTTTQNIPTITTSTQIKTQKCAKTTRKIDWCYLKEKKQLTEECPQIKIESSKRNAEANKNCFSFSVS